MKNRIRWTMIIAFLFTATLLMPSTGWGLNPGGRVFTFGTDFALGTLVGVNLDTPDQLQLEESMSTFPFIWVANSDGGTISKLDTVTGVELARYRTAPNGVGSNPSRTTVDQDGNVWVGNRDSNTITKVGLKEAGNCIDRNGNGVIDTSTGAGDVKDWPAGATVGLDECILMHVRLGTQASNNSNVRAVAIDADNNVFAGMSAGPNIYHVNGTTGAIMDLFTQPFSGNYPSYGAVVAPDGALWVAGDGNNAVVKHTFNPDGTHAVAQIIPLPGWAYGMGIAADGYIWISGWTYNNISKVRLSDGAIVGTWSLAAYGGNGLRGVAVDNSGDIWVASSYSNRVLRLHPDGSFAASVPVGNHPTGVAVDAAGKIWVTNYWSSNVTRVDPATNTADGTFAVGAGPYNYSDMTGSVIRNITTKQGSWTVVHDGGTVGMVWGTISWNGTTPPGTGISGRVRAADSTVGLGAESWTEATNGGSLTGVDGRFLQLEMKLTATEDGVSPTLYDITVDPQGSGPCTSAAVSGWISPLPDQFVAADGALDIALTRTACGAPVRDESVSIRVRNATTNALITGYTYGAGITIDSLTGEYHQAFVPATFGVAPGTRLKIMSYFGGRLSSTVYATVQ